MGKHVYCQKPLTWSIKEARMLRETAADTGVVTQMGNQGTSENGLREAVEVIRAGGIGEVKEVHVWTNRPIWPQGEGRPAGQDPVPDELNWDAWIGPAPMRPYVDGAYHSFNWRGWLDFGTGALGDMACHTTNMPVMALKLWDPVAVTAMQNSGIVDNEQYPSTSTLKFEFAARDGLAATDFYWYDGGNLPPEAIITQLPEAFQKRVADQKAGKLKRNTSGAVVVGTEGTIFSPDDYGAKYDLIRGGKVITDFVKPEQTLPRVPFEGNVDERQKWEFVKSITGEHEAGTCREFKIRQYSRRGIEVIGAAAFFFRSTRGAIADGPLRDSATVLASSHRSRDPCRQSEYRQS
jgi:hypothetical protein